MKTFNFFGVKIADVNIDLAKEIITNYHFSTPNYISFPDAYVVSLCQTNNYLKSILNSSLLTLPDGKPSAIMGKKKGMLQMEPVSGFWLCKTLLDTSLSHYFLGSTSQRLIKLKQQLEEEHPHAIIKGYSSPKFISEEEAVSGIVFKEEFEKINSLKPDLIWIGLSSPKQDYIIHNHLPVLRHGIMLGVGGVFDYLSGEVNKSPEWVKKIGLRWLWRLLNEPSRLWGKYIYTIRKLSIRFLIEYVKP